MKRAAALFSVAVGLSCARTPSAPSSPAESPSAPPPALRVGPDQPEALVAALRDGARRIELLPGVHRPPGEVHVARTTELFGQGGGGGARLYGRVVVTGRDVVIRDLQLRSGVAVRSARDLRIASSTLTAGGERDALTLVDATAELEGVVLQSGPESGLFATDSTVTWTRGRAEGGARSVRIDGGRFEGQSLAWRDARQTAFWADRGARTRLRAVRVETDGPGAMGLHVTDGAELVAGPLQVSTPGPSLVARTARVRLTDADVRHRGDQPALGVAGATVSVTRSSLRAGPGGAGSVGSHRRLRGRLDLEQVEVALDAGGTALTVGPGTLRMTGVRFEGSGPGALGAGAVEAAIVARGSRSRVDVRGLEVRRWPGLGGLFTADAAVRIQTATVARAAGGFAFEGVRHPESRISRVTIRGCVSDPGLSFAQSTAYVRTATISDCPPGGLVAGGAARVTAENVYVRGARFGFAAFDGARLAVKHARVETTTVSVLGGCVGDTRVVVESSTISSSTAATCR